MPESAELLARPQHSSITASAGCGKTEEIVKAVKISEGKQLILTHTNAGVASLKSRLSKYSVPASKFHIDTIASWLLRYAAAYPSMSGLVETMPEAADWQQVYLTAHNLFQRRFIRDVLQATYTGVFVDEYQDCTVSQHDVILLIADMLPVRVLGDPLQGIFGFGDDPLVDWDQDVVSLFPPLPELRTPWRWIDKNEQLGEWLLQIRGWLLSGELFDLSAVPEIDWRVWSVETELEVLYEALDKEGSTVGIHMWPKHAHESAKRLHGHYQSMEEMECKRLMHWAKRFDLSNEIPLAFEIINFVNECRVADDFFDEVVVCLRQKAIKELPSRISNPDLGYAFFCLVTQRDLSSIVKIIDLVSRAPGQKIHRRELLREMKRSVIEYLNNGHKSLHDAALQARFITRQVGRRIPKRIISRTLLIKGLEFDNAVILNASKLQNRMNFYVAVTRAARSLSILSENPVIQYKDNSPKN